MYGAREEMPVPKSKTSLYLDFTSFPKLRNLKLNDKGIISLGTSLVRETSEEGKNERWVRISSLDISKEKRVR